MSEVLKEWLSQELKRRNWSHNELARQAGLSQSTVSSVISGNRNAGADFCVKVASALDVPPEMLLKMAAILPSDSPPLDDPTLQELIELAKNLSPNQRRELLRYTRYLYQSGQEK